MEIYRAQPDRSDLHFNWQRQLPLPVRYKHCQAWNFWSSYQGQHQWDEIQIQVCLMGSHSPLNLLNHSLPSIHMPLIKIVKENKTNVTQVTQNGFSNIHHRRNFGQISKTPYNLVIRINVLYIWGLTKYCELNQSQHIGTQSRIQISEFWIVQEMYCYIDIWLTKVQKPIAGFRIWLSHGSQRPFKWLA